MTAEAFEELKQDIRENGQKMAITRQDGKIIDGRHRYKACLELGIEPRFEELDGKESYIAFCIAANLKRRHLTEFDKVEVAQKIGMFPVGSNQHTAGAGRSQGEMAVLLKTSPDTLQRGKKILNKGSENLKSAVRRGDVSVTVGAMMADLPQKKHDDLLEQGVRTAADVVKAINLDKKQKFREEKVKLIKDLAANSPTFEGMAMHSVIYADPPWDYLGFDGTPYPTMKLDEICDMKVKEVCTSDAVLLMWVPSAMLQDSFKVIEAWGFEYKSSAVWDKQTAGQGGYFRQQHEFLLVATKGNPPPVDPTATAASVIGERRGAHSAKPDRFYEIIEQMYPELDKLELFSRNQRDGWTMWGNQAGSDAAGSQYKV
jgi:N6-adenosine-specific RNA methylase IME4